MESISSVNIMVELIEEHLYDAMNTKQMAELVSRHVHMSPFTVQKVFQLVTGYSFGEYIKNRRLYEAASELTKQDTKIIDVAIKHGYDNQESFSKAFKRFHGITPSMARKRQIPITSFLPLKIELHMQGGLELNYTREYIDKFALIGFVGTFSFPSSYEEIPKFCQKIKKKYLRVLNNGMKPENEYEQAVIENNIGEYGAVINDLGNSRFRYLIGGLYNGGDVPEGMVLEYFDAKEWLKFTCTGRNPNAIQRLNTQIFRDWIKNNKQYKFDYSCNIEWYSSGDIYSKDYISGIWVPLK